MTGQKIKAVIFDMDGVIVDSEPLWTEALVEFLRRRGIKIDGKSKEYGEYKRWLMGCRQIESINFFKKIYQLEGATKNLVEERKRIVLDIFARKLKLNPGVLNVIKDLDRRKILLGLASSSSMDIIEFVLNKFNLKPYLKVCISAEESARGKPAPDVFLKAAEKLGVRPEACLVFEDSLRGIRAAKAAGMKCAVVLHEFNKEENLQLADQIIANWKEIDIIKLLN